MVREDTKAEIPIPSDNLPNESAAVHAGENTGPIVAHSGSNDADAADQTPHCIAKGRWRDDRFYRRKIHFPHSAFELRALRLVNTWLYLFRLRTFHVGCICLD